MLPSTSFIGQRNTYLCPGIFLPRLGFTSVSIRSSAGVSFGDSSSMMCMMSPLTSTKFGLFFLPQPPTISQAFSNAVGLFPLRCRPFFRFRVFSVSVLTLRYPVFPYHFTQHRVGSLPIEISTSVTLDPPFPTFISLGTAVSSNDSISLETLSTIFDPRTENGLTFASSSRPTKSNWIPLLIRVHG